MQSLDFKLSKRSVSRRLLKFSSTGEIDSLRKQNCIEPFFMRKNKNTQVLINWMKMGKGLGFCNAKKEMFVFESSRATTFMKVATHTNTHIYLLWFLNYNLVREKGSIWFFRKEKLHFDASIRPFITMKKSITQSGSQFHCIENRDIGNFGQK